MFQRVLTFWGFPLGLTREGDITAFPIDGTPCYPASPLQLNQLPDFMRIPSILALTLTALTAAPLEISGIYPSLAYYNQEGECGTGAVVPWADRLWVVTYAPHKPKGSTDKLYEITPDLKQIIRQESIGGTPANRMIHPESQQLFIGPHVIDAKGNVRTVPVSDMFGRLTGNARSLTDPANKILYATMEEGIYEVDVHTLAVKDLWIDEQLQTGGEFKKGVAESKPGRKANLPGYHGKGFYSGQGRYVYANNGDHAREALSDPTVPSGVLAEWDGKADKWTVVRRNQFTDVTGPGGILGGTDSANDPLWAIGWDHRSLILMCLSEGKWNAFRLPKGSHSYDGAHGWNTEWPRIRDIGEKDLLMTMHGTFWKFPKDFSPKKSAGITPRSNYLKVIGDFSKWNDRLVFGCDDTAKSEFLSSRKAKGKINGPQSQSNLWFMPPSQLDHIGPAIGRGSVWIDEPVKAGEPSDSFLFSGYDHRIIHLNHDLTDPVTFTLEVDHEGNGSWTKLREINVAPGKERSVAFTKSELGAWIRVTTSKDCTKATAAFSYRNDDRRTDTADPIFDGLAKAGDTTATGGLVRALDGDKRSLGFAARAVDGTSLGYYQLDADLKLVKQADKAALVAFEKETAIPEPTILDDEASAIYIEDDGTRWRMPKGETSELFGKHRLVREVATERDLLDIGGTFYELPARNAGGASRMRPVATHNRMIQDFCSYRGLFICSGVSIKEAGNNPHIIRSDDGKTALWAGAIDDVWKFGKPRGKGGPWKDTAVIAGTSSDPYLMTAYDKKSLTLSADADVKVTMEVDLSGAGNWVKLDTLEVSANKPLVHAFPDAFSAYWIRFTADKDCKATAQLTYE